MSEYDKLGHDCSLLRLPNWLLTSISAFDATFFFRGAAASSGPGRLQYRDFTLTLRHTTVGRTSSDDAETST